MKLPICEFNDQEKVKVAEKHCNTKPLCSRALLTVILWHSKLLLRFLNKTSNLCNCVFMSQYPQRLWSTSDSSPVVSVFICNVGPTTPFIQTMQNLNRILMLMLQTKPQNIQHRPAIHSCVHGKCIKVLGK